MGLLDEFSEFAKTPAGQGLLAATFGGLAGATKGAPINSLGRAGLAGMSGYSNAIDMQQKLKDRQDAEALRQLQMEQARGQLARQKKEWATQDKEEELAPQFFTPAVKGVAPLMGDSILPPDQQTGILPSAGMPSKPASYDLQGYATALMGVNPKKGIELLQATAKDTPFNKVDPKDFTSESIAKFGQTRNYADLVPRVKREVSDGVVYDPYAVQPNTVLPNPNKPFMPDGKGGVVPNMPYQNYELGKARAGATNVSTKVENKMGEGIASQIGPMVKDTYNAANGAASQIDAAGRIVKAVDSGKIIAGPLAGGRLKVAQVGQLLGVSGKDDAETIARSREVIRGLSEMTLQGRKQMTGQGAITESEGKLAEKAMSGDIADLTPAEIKQLARASARAAKFVYDQHQQNIVNMQQDPATAGLAKFYKTMPLPSLEFMNEPAPQSIHDRAAAILGGK